MVPAMLWCLPISVHLLPASLVLAFIRQVVSNFYFCCEGCFQCAASLMCDACAMVWTLDCLSQVSPLRPDTITCKWCDTITCK